jgi:hypothetical protein
VTLIRICLPTVPPSVASSAPAYLVDGPLAGLRVGIRTEGQWRSWLIIAREWSRFLQRDVAHPEVLKTGERVGNEGIKTRRSVQQWVETIDCGIVGLGTCGSCTSWSVRDAIEVENREKPALVVVTTEFEIHARNMAAHLGHADLKMLVLPYPLETLPDEELIALAEAHYVPALDLLGAQLA